MVESQPLFDNGWSLSPGVNLPKCLLMYSHVDPTLRANKAIESSPSARRGSGPDFSGLADGSCLGVDSLVDIDFEYIWYVLYTHW